MRISKDAVITYWCRGEPDSDAAVNRQPSSNVQRAGHTRYKSVALFPFKNPSSEVPLLRSVCNCPTGSHLPSPPSSHSQVTFSFNIPVPKWEAQHTTRRQCRPTSTVLAAVAPATSTPKRRRKRPRSGWVCDFLSSPSCPIVRKVETPRIFCADNELVCRTSRHLLEFPRPLRSRQPSPSRRSRRTRAAAAAARATTTTPRPWLP